MKTLLERVEILEVTNVKLRDAVERLLGVVERVVAVVGEQDATSAVSKKSKQANWTPPLLKSGKSKNRKPPTAARVKSMKLQGVYLGLLRGLAPGVRALVKAAAKKRGVAAAIALGNKLKKKD